MKSNIRNIDTAGTTNGAGRIATTVASEGAGTVTSLRQRSESTTFGAAVTAADRHDAGVRAVAARYGSFEDALLPMVLASGVSGDAAIAVAEAIQANPALRAQAERAFQRAQLSSV